MTTTNTQNLPDRWVRALGGLEARPPRTAYRYGVNELLDSVRIRQLRMRHHEQIHEDVSDRTWMLIGNGVHAALEYSADPNALTEEKLTIEREIAGRVCTIAGVPDYYDEDGHVADYKTSKAYYLVFDPNGKIEHQWQTHLYRLMLEEHGFPVKSQSIDVVLRDHDEWKGKTEEGYPRTAIQIIPVERLEKAQIEAYVTERLRLHVAAETAEDADLPECSFHERWEKEPKFAVTKTGNKKAARVLDSQEDAEKWVADDNAKRLEKGGKAVSYTITLREGERTRCERFCPVAEFCTQHQRYVAEKAAANEEK